MRTYGLWTLENRTEDRVFFGLYKLGDKSYGAALDGHKGWIEANKAIDIKVDFRKIQIVFWKAHPTLGAGKKLAPPKQVTTDRAVVLTRDHKIVQADEADFTDPDVVGRVIFLTSMEVNNIARGIVVGIAGKVPEVGGAIAALIGFLWKEQKEEVKDLIQQSVDRMKRWVQGRIYEYDREFLSNTLAGVRANLDEYHHAKGPKQRLDLFEIVLAACDRAMPFFTKHGYTPGTIDMAAAVATIHLTLLRERVLFADEIFGDDEVDEAFFRQKLKDTIAAYQTFIRDVAFPGELKWRQEEIHDQKVLKEQRFLTDKVTREIHAFSHTGRSQLKQGPSQVCVDFYRAQADNSYGIQLRENVLLTALFWTWMDPERIDEKPLPLDHLTWVGPLAGLSYMVGNEHDHKFADYVEEKPGRVREILVWAGDGIDALQFNFDGRSGHRVGLDGGKKHVVPVPAGAFLSRVETWFDFDLFAVRFHFSDGTRSPTFGTPSRGGIHQTAQFPDHQVSAVRIGRRMHELHCGFTPLPDYYERLKKRPA